MLQSTSCKYSNLLYCFSFVGILDSLFILITKYNCSTCINIHNSYLGRPFGIPLAVFGLIGYLITALAVKLNKPYILLSLTTFGFIVSAFLVYTQIFWFYSLCLPCCFSAIVMSSLFCISLYLILTKYLPSVLVPLLLLIFIYFIFSITSNNTLNAFHPALSEPNTSNTILVYTSKGKPVNLLIYDKPILYISSDCGACDKTLYDLPTTNRPILVDTLIQGPLQDEVKAMQEKLKPFGIPADAVFYDLQNEAPVSGVPTLTEY